MFNQSPVSLVINGQPRRDFLRFEFKSSLTSACNSWSAIFAETAKFGIPFVDYGPQDSVSIKIYGRPVSSAIIDVATISADPARRVDLAGRDVTAHAIDSSARAGTGQFKNVTLLDFANQLLRPLRLSISAIGPVAPLAAHLFESATIDTGETIHEAIERHCRPLGLLIRTTPAGLFEFFKPGLTYAPAPLKLGYNILKITNTKTQNQRFAEYVAYSQKQGTKTTNGSAAAHVSGSASDSEISSTRVFIVDCERGMSPAECETRARWEANNRAAQASKVTLTVKGFRAHETAAIWSPGMIVDVNAPEVSVVASLVIADCTLVWDEQSGETTELTLVRPGAFDLEPSAIKAATKSAKKTKSPGVVYRKNDMGYFDVLEVPQ